jgi:hypothetical protein
MANAPSVTLKEWHSFAKINIHADQMGCAGQSTASNGFNGQPFD